MFIEPSVFDEPCPFAFQFHDVNNALPSLTEPSFCKVNPSLPKAVNVEVLVVSAEVALESIYFVAPLTLSNNL